MVKKTRTITLTICALLLTASAQGKEQPVKGLTCILEKSKLGRTAIEQATLKLNYSDDGLGGRAGVGSFRTREGYVIGINHGLWSGVYGGFAGYAVAVFNNRNQPASDYEYAEGPDLFKFENVDGNTMKYVLRCRVHQ